MTLRYMLRTIHHFNSIKPLPQECDLNRIANIINSLHYEMLLFRTIAVIALTNCITVLSNIIHTTTTKKFDINTDNERISMDQMKNIRQSFLIGGKHDVEEIDNTKYK
ncbi:hypothetical protein LOAG_15038, partial [Loa loa]